MSFGRLDVYWPDGPVESYRLDKPVVAVGRSTGNDIVLDTTAISRYHITLTFKNQQALLEDLQSVNGTYVDSVRLPANEPFLLRGGEEIQIGDVLLIYHPLSDATSPLSDTTQRITLSQLTYRVELEGPDMAVAPGAHSQATLKIENLGDTVDRYLIEVEGLPAGWARLDRAEMEVEPGEEGQAIISFKPLRRSESKPGDYPIVVRVRPKSQPQQTSEVPTIFRVLPYSGFGMALESTRVNRDGSFKLYLHNQGNAPLSINLRGSDPLQALRFQFPATTMTLGPGERQTITGTVKPRRPRLFGSEREHEFAIYARALDASGFLASLPGTVVEKGALPAWVPVLTVPLMALGALLLAGLLLLLFTRDDEEPVSPPQEQPLITAFSLSAPSAIVGDEVQVNWAVMNAETLMLTISRGDERQDVPIEQTNSALPLAFDQSGRYHLTLTARNGEAETTQTAELQVVPRAALAVDLRGATQLVLYTPYTVRVSWEVSGAAEFSGGYNLMLSLRRPDQSERVLSPAPMPLTGSMDVEIVPEEEQGEWEFVLVAVGNDQVQAIAQQPIQLPVIHPVCDLTAPETVFRSGPGEAYPAVIPPLKRPAEGNLSMMVLGRDPSGDWLQATYGAGQNARRGWIRRQDFTCTGFDPERLVVVTDYPAPPPTATPTSSPATPRPSPTPTARPLTAAPR